MTLDPFLLVALVIPVIGAVVWLVRLEGRINVADARYADIVGRLARIEQKLDHLNGERG